MCFSCLLSSPPSSAFSSSQTRNGGPTTKRATTTDVNGSRATRARPLNLPSWRQSYGLCLGRKKEEEFCEKKNSAFPSSRSTSPSLDWISVLHSKNEVSKGKMHFLSAVGEKWRLYLHPIKIACELFLFCRKIEQPPAFASSFFLQSEAHLGRENKLQYAHIRPPMFAFVDEANPLTLHFGVDFRMVESWAFGRWANSRRTYR